MGVGDDVAGLIRAVADGIAGRYRSLFNGVDDCRGRTGVLGQIAPSVAPAVARVERDRAADSGAIGLQLYADAQRADPVLVVGIVPDLAYRDARDLRHVGVGDDVAGLIGAVADGVAGWHRGLLDRVSDLDTGRVLVKARPSVAPAVATVQINGRADGDPVGFQLDADAQRTDPVLVVGVVPDLAHRDAGCFRNMVVGDDKFAVFDAVADGVIGRYR